MHLAACALGVFYRTFAQSEQGVVFAATHVLTGMEVSATLTNQMLPALDEFASKALATGRLAFESRPLRMEPDLLMCH